MEKAPRDHLRKVFYRKFGPPTNEKPEFDDVLRFPTANKFHVNRRFLGIVANAGWTFVIISVFALIVGRDHV